MTELRGHRPRLVVRESPVFQALALIMLLGLLGGLVWIALRESFPLPVIILSAGGMLLLLLIQIRILFGTLRPGNWLIRFYSHGIALQTGGHLSGGEHRTLFIPAEALRGARIVEEPRLILQPRGRDHWRESGRFTFLEILADKGRVSEVDPGHRRVHVTAPRPIRLRFLFMPVTENDEGYRIELRSRRSRVTPSVSRIARAFRTFGIQPEHLRLTANLMALDDDAFEARVVRAGRQGDRQQAVDMLQERHRITGGEASRQLEAIMARHGEAEPGRG